jgi:hypothetical protein
MDKLPYHLRITSARWTAALEVQNPRGFRGGLEFIF